MTTTNARPLVLRPHEARRLAKHGDALIVRVAKPQPHPSCSEDGCGWHWHPKGRDDHYVFGADLDHLAASLVEYCPFGRVGDELWCKEAFVTGYDVDDSGYLIMEDENGEELPEKVWYRADGEEMQWWDDGDRVPTPWRSAVTMPRELSRFTVRVESVAYRRIRSITDKDAKRMGHEGIPYKDDHDVHHDGHRAEFMRVVGKIHGPAAWADDVFCWFGMMRMKGASD